MSVKDQESLNTLNSQKLIKALHKLQIEQTDFDLQFKLSPEENKLFADCLSPIGHEEISLSPILNNMQTINLSNSNSSNNQFKTPNKENNKFLARKNGVKANDLQKSKTEMYKSSNGKNGAGRSVGGLGGTSGTGKKTPLQIEQELLSELSQLDGGGLEYMVAQQINQQQEQGSSQINFMVTAKFNNFLDEDIQDQITKGIIDSNGQSLNQEVIKSSTGQHDIYNQDNNFEKRLEQKKKQIRDASRGKDIDQLSSSSRQFSQISPNKLFRPPPNLNTSQLSQENQLTVQQRVELIKQELEKSFENKQSYLKQEISQEKSTPSSVKQQQKSTGKQLFDSNQHKFQPKETPRFKINEFPPSQQQSLRNTDQKLRPSSLKHPLFDLDFNENALNNLNLTQFQSPKFEHNNDYSNNLNTNLERIVDAISPIESANNSYLTIEASTIDVNNKQYVSQTPGIMSPSQRQKIRAGMFGEILTKNQNLLHKHKKSIDFNMDCENAQDLTQNPKYNIFSNDQTIDQISCLDELKSTYHNNQNQVANEYLQKSSFRLNSEDRQNDQLQDLSTSTFQNNSKSITQARFKNQDSSVSPYQSNPYSPLPSGLNSERTTFKQNRVNQTGYLRRDMQADCDDKNSDNTLQSVFNQYQSQNTSFLIGFNGAMTADGLNSNNMSYNGIDDYYNLNSQKPTLYHQKPNQQQNNDIENTKVQIGITKYQQTSGNNKVINDKNGGNNSTNNITIPKLNLPLREIENESSQCCTTKGVISHGPSASNEWNQIVNEAKDNIINKSSSNFNTLLNNKSQNKHEDISQLIGNNSHMLNMEGKNKRLFLRHLIKKKPNQDHNQQSQQNQNLAQQNVILNSDNPSLLADNIIFLTLIGKKKFHTYLISDQEANRCRLLYKSLLAKSKADDCHEAYFGLAKIYFHLNRLEVAYDCICKAVIQRYKQSREGKEEDWVYYLWQGLILYYLISFSQMKLINNESSTVQKYLKECERCLTKAYKLANNHLKKQAQNTKNMINHQYQKSEYLTQPSNQITTILFLLLKLSIWTEKQEKKYKIQFSKKAKDYALKIKKSNEYLGYLAWAEIYISQRHKRQLGIQVLEDLIRDYNQYPQAYLRLWSIYHINKQYQKALELAEKMYIFGTSYSNEAISLNKSSPRSQAQQNSQIRLNQQITIFRSSLISLLFAKSLFLNREYLRCYELLQNEFMAFPQFNSFLYAYAKYVIRAEDAQATSLYLGSAIGALEECLRSQVKERHAKLFYYMGLGYQKMNQPLRVYENWVKYLHQSSKKQVERRREVKEQTQMFEKFSALIARIDDKIIIQLKTIKTAKVNIVDLEGQKFLQDLELQDQLDQPTKLLTKAKIYGYLLRDKQNALETYELLINKYPSFLDGFISFWNFLKISKMYSQAYDVGLKTVKASDSTKVPTSLWVLSRMNMSKSYMLNKEVKKSIDVLKEICFLLPPFPMCEIPFVDQVLENLYSESQIDNHHPVLVATEEEPMSMQYQSEYKDYFSFAHSNQNTTQRKQHESVQIIQIDEEIENGASDQQFLGYQDKKMQKLLDYQYQEQDRDQFFQTQQQNKLQMQSMDSSPFQIVQNQIAEEVNILDLEGARETSGFKPTEEFNGSSGKQIKQDQDDTPFGERPITPRRLFTDNKIINSNDPSHNNQKDSERKIFEINKQSLALDPSQIQMNQDKCCNIQRQSFAQLNSARKRISRFSFMQNSSRRSTHGGPGGDSNAQAYQSYQSNTHQRVRESQLSLYSSNLGDEYGKVILDSEGFAIYSNVKFLLLIGKICAETGLFLEDGMGALNDYLQILEFYRMDMSEQNFEELKLKANYYIGLIFYKERDLEMAQQYFVDIIIDLKEKGYKVKYEKAQSKLSKMYRRLRKETITDYFK